MTSPYSSNLLQTSVHDEDGATATATRQIPRPAQAQPTRSVTHVVAPAPMPVPVAAPVYAPQPFVTAPRGGAAATAIGAVALALVVLLVGAVALIGGYYATRQAAPTAEQAGAETSLAMREGYAQGRQRGLGLGRADGAAAAGTTARLRAATERQKAWDTAYQKGMRAGSSSYRRPRSYGFGTGYRAPRFSYPRVSETTAAIGAAQQIANATGAPVDVQVFG